MKKKNSHMWSKAKRARYNATIKARRKARERGTGVPATSTPPKGPKALRGRDADPGRDAVAFLEMAERSILSKPRRRFSCAETYAMLALHTLRGET